MKNLRGTHTLEKYIPVHGDVHLLFYVGKGGRNTVVTVTEGALNRTENEERGYGWTSFSFSLFEAFRVRLYAGTDRLTEKRCKELFDRWLPEAENIAAHRREVLTPAAEAV